MIDLSMIKNFMCNKTPRVEKIDNATLTFKLCPVLVTSQLVRRMCYKWRHIKSFTVSESCKHWKFCIFSWPAIHKHYTASLCTKLVLPKQAGDMKHYEWSSLGPFQNLTRHLIARSRKGSNTIHINKSWYLLPEQRTHRDLLHNRISPW